jgi:hypothetical protein
MAGEIVRYLGGEDPVVLEPAAGDRVDEFELELLRRAAQLDLRRPRRTVRLLLDCMN